METGSGQTASAKGRVFDGGGNGNSEEYMTDVIRSHAADESAREED
jgi:hypothetical protein